MTSTLRDLDIIVFGATAFTGRLAAEYLARNFPVEVRWAISGRNKDKLEKIFEGLQSYPNPPRAHFIVDHLDRERVFELVRKTKVVVSFAGPFARYGENVASACAQLGTHYVDITGETVWIQDMIRKYEAKAKESGAIMIPFSGFDSIPSDLGVWQVLEEAKTKNADLPITKVVSLFTVKGGINGGTFETLLDSLKQDKKVEALFRDSALLVPDNLKQQLRFPDRRWPVYLKEAKATVPPFFMAPINSRVVYRSQALRMTHFADSQQPFEYLELQRVPRRFSKSRAWWISLSSNLLNHMGRYTLGRKILRHYGPKAGEGPSQMQRKSGYFRAQIFAYHREKKIASSEISFQGDPGNEATVLMACESVRCLLFDRERLPKIPGGFWTPSTALGPALRNRLIAAGMKVGLL